MSKSLQQTSETQLTEQSEHSSPSTREVKAKLAIKELVRGKSRQDVADKYGFTTAEMFRIEEDYYRGLDMLDEHAMLMKQLTRLETLVDILWDQIQTFGLTNDKGDFGANLSSAVALLREISELAGLKKKQVQSEVRIIQEQQVPMIVAYVDAVLREYDKKLDKYLTAKGRRELASKREDLYAEITAEPVKLLEGTAEMVV